MSDSSEEKKFPASQRKLQRLRQDGQVPRSQDFPAAVSLTAVFLYLILAYPRNRDLLAAALIVTPAHDERDFVQRIHETMGAMLHLLVAIAAPAFAVGILTHLVVSIIDAKGLPVSAKSVTPNFGKLNPAQGLKNMFGVQGLAELGKALVKTMLIFVAMILLMWFRLNDVMWGPACGATCVLPLALRIFTEAILICLIIYLIAAAADLKISRALFMKQNKMTLTEVKRESKEEMGDPHVRNQRRQIAREIATSKVIRGIARANLLMRSGEAVVGIAYIAGETPVPVVVAKAYGEEAREFIFMAQGKGVPVIDSPGTVEDLIKRVSVGRGIPADTFEPVARALIQGGVV
jgi:type III secretion protein U